MKVKVCGITRVEDALLVAELGADLVGFIFAGESPRRIDFSTARGISEALPAKVGRIGVFTDVDRGNVLEAVEAARLSGVQFHGAEPAGFASELRSRGLLTIRAFGIAESITAHDIAASECDIVLFDSPRLGLRRALDVDLARRLRPSRPVFIAGGLTASNVAGYVRTLSPAGVDLASGVESSPGIKDKHLVQEFFLELKRIKEELAT